VESTDYESASGDVLGVGDRRVLVQLGPESCTSAEAVAFVVPGIGTPVALSV